jgi:hypothetical protein
VSLGRARAVHGRATSTKLPTKSWGPQTSNQALTTTVLRTQRDATRHGEQSSGSSFGPPRDAEKGSHPMGQGPCTAVPCPSSFFLPLLCAPQRGGSHRRAMHARAATLSWIPLYLLSLSLLSLAPYACPAYRTGLSYTLCFSLLFPPLAWAIPIRLARRTTTRYDATVKMLITAWSMA